MRKCTRCEQTKPASEFHAHPRSPDNLQAKCKDCQRDEARERYRAKHGKRRYEDDWDEDGRRCTECDTRKPWDAFPKRAAGKNGRGSKCRACVNRKRADVRAADPEAARAKEREWARRSGVHARRRYGLSPADLAAMTAAQGGRCAICRRTPKRLVVDHDHDTGKVRGLLCDRCNHRVHLIDEDGLLEAMVAYVEAARTKG